MSINYSPACNELTQLQPFAQLKVPKHVRNMIILFLPIDDILNLDILCRKDNSIEIHPLLHASEQNQICFRFTRDMHRVWTRAQMSQLGIRYNDCHQICAKLGRLQRQMSNFHLVITRHWSGLQASTTDEPTQGIDCTLDGKRETWWSSDGSVSQDKVDWLLYDLGTVAVINRVSIAAFEAIFHLNSPVYGFKKCWIEFGFNSEEFHYKTKVFSCQNTNELQNFTVGEDLDNIFPTARYIKFWMQGCYQKQRTDDRWYFAIGNFVVGGMPLDCFPDPVPKTLDVIRNIKSKTEEK